MNCGQAHVAVSPVAVVVAAELSLLLVSIIITPPPGRSQLPKATTTMAALAINIRRA
jgi:hypothetical protein